MENYLVVWPKSKDIVHINYHYTDFGEIVDYLNSVFPNQVVALDCDINDVHDVAQLIKDARISKVAMMVNYENVQSAMKMAEQISKQVKVPLMAYGNLTVKMPKLFLNSKFNALFSSGDYESGIEAFFKSYPNIEGMHGLIKLDCGKAEFGANGKFISPDDWGYSKPVQVPVFAYDKIKGKNRYVLNISRGCPFGCKHCLIQMIEGRMERRRSISNVDSVLADVTRHYNHIKIWAANFTLNKKYVMDFCDVMNSYPDVTWECATRLDLLEDEGLIQAMADAGCRQISIGIEMLNSGKLIESKKFAQSQVEDVIKRVQKYGIKVKGCIMLGIPGQTRQDIIDTLKFLQENNVSTRPTIFTPYHEVEDVSLKELTQLNRKTYRNTNVTGVSPEQLIQLARCPFEYNEILSQTKQINK